MLAELMPAEPRSWAGGAHGSPGLPGGDAHGCGRNLILLEDQDRTGWDRARIARGLRASIALERWSAWGPISSRPPIARATRGRSAWEATDWSGSWPLRGSRRVAPSAGGGANRAVAIGLAEGPAAGLAAIDAIEASRSAVSSASRCARRLPPRLGRCRRRPRVPRRARPRRQRARAELSRPPGRRLRGAGSGCGP